MNKIILEAETTFHDEAARKELMKMDARIDKLKQSILEFKMEVWNEIDKITGQKNKA